ncbi:MAG: alpha/beta hydrolase [Pseudomonadota bacterium]
MGGLILFDFIFRYYKDFKNKDNIKGFCFSSPFLALRNNSKLKEYAAHLGAQLNASFNIPGQIDPYSLSHDRLKVKEYIEDPLIFKYVNIRWISQTVLKQKEILKNEAKIEKASLFLLAEDDKLCDNDITEAIYSSISFRDKTKKVYKALYHEIFNETSRDEIFDDFSNWIIKRI